MNLAWRHTVDGLTWRLAVASDLPRLHELWDAMEHRLGTQDKPDLFAMPVVLTLVAEDEHGTVVSAFYGEAVIDFTGIGTDRRAAKSIDSLFPALQQFLGDRTIRLARVFVPMRLANGMRRLLPRMADVSAKYASFVFRVRP